MNETTTRLQTIAADVDRYAQALGKGKAAAPKEYCAVMTAFVKAEVRNLKKVRKVCVRLFPMLDQQLQNNLIHQNSAKARFWNKIRRTTAV